MREIAKTGAAEFFLDRDTEETKFAELRPQFARKFIGAVNFVGKRRDLVLGKCTHRVAQHVHVAAEAKVETGNAVLHHRTLPHRGYRGRRLPSLIDPGTGRVSVPKRPV